MTSLNKPITYSHLLSMALGAIVVLVALYVTHTPNAQAAGNVAATNIPNRAAIVVTTSDYPSGGNVTQTAGAIVVDNPITKTVTVVGYVGGSYQGSNTMGLSTPATFTYQ